MEKPDIYVSLGYSDEDLARLKHALLEMGEGLDDFDDFDRSVESDLVKIRTFVEFDEGGATYLGFEVERVDVKAPALHGAVNVVEDYIPIRLGGSDICIAMQ